MKKSRTPVLVSVAVLVGLGLGASVLRGQVPVSEAQRVGAQTVSSTVAPGTQVLNEGAARLPSGKAGPAA